MRSILLLLFITSAAASAQSVGDFSLNYKENQTGPQTVKSWPKANSTLWGTNASGNPQSIILSGLTLSNGVLTASGGTWDSITGKPSLSTGGNGAADAGKLLQFGDDGEIQASLFYMANLTVFDRNAGTQFIAGANGLQMINSDGFTGYLNPGTITAPRTWTLQDASGTLALTSDLTPYLLSATASTTYVPVTRTINGNALSSNITISTITGNAGTATKLATARNLNGVAFDGSADATIPAAGSTLTDTVPLTKGGTGQITAQAAINSLMAASGALSQGDVFYFNGTNVVRLAAGTANYYLQTQGAGANPVWAGAATLGANTYTGQQTIANGTITTSKPLTISQTWNAAVDFSALLVDVHITSFNNGPSSLFRLRMNDVDRLFVDHGGSTYFGGNTAATSSVLIDTNARVITMRNGTRLDGEGDTGLYRDGSPGIWAMKLGSTAHKLRIYGGSGVYFTAEHDGANAVLSASSGSISVTTPLSMPSGSNARTGNATLVAGTVTVANTTVTANTRVIPVRKTSGGTIGNLTYTLSAGASFTINSDSITDTSVITYLLIENP